jgi:hypothetical protein
MAAKRGGKAKALTRRVLQDKQLRLLKELVALLLLE